MWNVGCGTSCVNGIATRLVERVPFRRRESSAGSACFAWRGGDLRVLCENSVGKPDAGNRHVRFDEREKETGDCHSVSHRAFSRLYPGNGQHQGMSQTKLRIHHWLTFKAVLE